MPYTLDWAWSADSLSEVHFNLRNSYAPVALFDKDYDDMGIDVLRKKQYPELKSGTTETRTLVLYNDCYTDENVQVEVRLESQGKLLANDIRDLKLTLGEHLDFRCEFMVTATGYGKIDLVLITRKNGKLTFREVIAFKVVPGAEKTEQRKTYLKIL